MRSCFLDESYTQALAIEDDKVGPRRVVTGHGLPHARACSRVTPANLVYPALTQIVCLFDMFLQ
ncbi:hypothetical protein PLICRDRAFT_49727 [Plicaturopsis crispa FD-325 SS-3]|nr:hypothetical protein PLICRDRAFT_49727 [Plicaturopsis crispa FD-325 SS-3]